MAQSVYAYASASEFAIANRPNGLRATWHGVSPPSSQNWSANELYS